MKKLLPIVAILLVSTLGVAQQADKDKGKPDNQTQTVVAEGVGTKADDALKDAFRNAVRQVVGAVVDAETLVKNDKIITDKVLTYSDGFIKKYDELSKTEDKGLFRIRIKAEVERRSVVAKLQTAKVMVKDVDGKGIFAELVTGLEAEKNAKEMVAKGLEGFPLNCLEAEVIGKPEVIEKDDKGAKLQITVRVRANEQAYAAFTKKLMKTFDGIAKDKGTYMTKEGQSSYYKYHNVLGESNVSGIQRKHKDHIAFAMMTQKTDNYDQATWAYYVLDKSTSEPLTACSSRALAATLMLLDGDGNLVAQDRWNLQSPLFGSLAIQTDNRKVPKPPQVISPLLLWRSNNGLAVCGPTCEFKRTLRLSLKEIKAIESVKCELK